MRLKRSLRRLLGSTILVVLFVAVQATVVSHLDLDAHSQDTPCALCVGASVFGGSNVSSAHFAIPEASSPELPDNLTASIAAPLRSSRLARAPPFVS